MKYTIGIDYGTLSARALLVDVKTGRDVASAVYHYPHGVMDKSLAGKPLGQDWALEHPRDFLDALCHIVPEAMRLADVSAEDVIGVGVDFTSCTMLPVKADGTPLCFIPGFEDNPHAYAKLWKHHAAEPEADKLSDIARERGEKWLMRYGGKVSSEYMMPKIWQILNEAPEVYAAADFFTEACDWIVWQLTGERHRSMATLSFKALYGKTDGFPGPEFFRALDPRLERVVSEKLSGPIRQIGDRAGGITEEMAKRTGLLPGTAVAVGTADGYSALPAVGVTRPGSICAILGTSGVYLALSDKLIDIPGLFGAAEDGLMPGYIGYEFGQSCLGDHLEWFVKSYTSREYLERAESEGIDIYSYFNRLAQKLHPGESGLIALDWWNGNRSILSNANLTGLIVGMTLATRPEEIYRALMEAMAFGARRIAETLSTAMPVEEIRATGGIAKKSPLFMQIYADVLGIPIRVAETSQGPALGSAIFATVAAGARCGGYNTILEASEAMQSPCLQTYYPNRDNKVLYDRLYDQYKILHDYFGRGNRFMESLKKLRTEAAE
jgi:L-ribulokinase